MRKRFRGPMKREKGPRRNEEIRAENVRLIDDTGKMVGIVSLKEALNIAYNKGLDIVEVNPNGDPPVVKIMDYGKYKYEQEKKKQEAKKKQATITVKEVQFRPRIDKHDFEVKLKRVKNFLEEGNKVKVVIVFRGRELAHVDLGEELIDKIIEELGDSIKVDSRGKLEGRRITVMLSPVKKK